MNTRIIDYSVRKLHKSRKTCTQHRNGIRVSAVDETRKRKSSENITEHDLIYAFAGFMFPAKIRWHLHRFSVLNQIWAAYEHFIRNAVVATLRILIHCLYGRAARQWRIWGANVVRGGKHSESILKRRFITFNSNNRQFLLYLFALRILFSFSLPWSPNISKFWGNAIDALQRASRRSTIGRDFNGHAARTQ